MLFVYWFKAQVGVVNDLVEGQHSSLLLSKLTDIERYGIIIVETLKKLTDPGLWGIVPFALPFAAWTFRYRMRLQRHTVLQIGLVLAICAAYGLVYLLTPHDICWHVRHSVARLAFHVTPLGLYAFFLSFNTDSLNGHQASLTAHLSHGDILS